ncbi:TRAP transporter small permease subunit [Pseudorhodobacter sp. E13]|uniref:TRAP transporter small permease subunit n=1 Tax=Pseudorhodobacter sp. E13 TaxID=2487931 RepID=UPI000F8CCE22|nr:TRAP transporter small permease subunit [Pseudorhodobacter sp. E13]RUS60566.1 TRAP transporter small permease subunit [Pseudorhodobacter sp. E13]
MLDGIFALFSNIAMSFVHFFYAITHPGEWLGWLGELGQLETVEAKEALGRFIFYGASKDFFFVVFTAFLVLTAVGIWRKSIMWAVVRGLEWFANTLGRAVAWVGLLMVLQQIFIVFLQRIFSASAIEFGPFAPFGYKLMDGFTFVSHDVSWWSEELKLYNAMIVCLCVTYTFVQGGHVRVDLVYARLSYRAKRVVDMAGTLVFMMPAAIMTWLFAWFFMWRHLLTPKISASDSIDQIMRKAKVLKWNVETIGFSPNGFDAYYLFKILMLAFTALVFLHAIAFFYRSMLEWREGPEEDGKYLDLDSSVDASATGTH